VAIERAVAKQHELEAQQPSGKATAKVLAMLTKAAEEFRRQLALGLGGSERDVLRARVALRRHFGGEIRMVTEPTGGVVAHWNEPVGAVFQAVVTSGSGGPQRPLLVVPRESKWRIAGQEISWPGWSSLELPRSARCKGAQFLQLRSSNSHRNPRLLRGANDNAESPEDQ